MADRRFFGLLTRREITVPSLKGWALFILLAAPPLCFAFRGLQSFLAVNAPLRGQALVVEGWIPDYAQREALAIFRAHGYHRLIVTGGPLPPGTPFASFGTYAALAAATLLRMGLGPDSLSVVPSPLTARDRTYTEALSLREWMRTAGFAPEALDLVSFAAHARRSRLLYARALRGVARVGVYAPADIGYDGHAWWKTSNGVRSVVDETVGYVYARLLFHP